MRLFFMKKMSSYDDIKFISPCKRYLFINALSGHSTFIL